jgi:hypothetical protein
MHTTFQTLGHHGRLGNQLFQVAATIGTARRNHCDFIFPHWWYSPFFLHPLPQSDNIPVEATYEERDLAYTPIDLEVSTNLWGYFQSEKYFKHCENELRHYLTPNDRLMAMVYPCLEKLFHHLDQSKTCSVCIRRGDYVGNIFYAQLYDTSYYQNAFRRFDTDTEFVVFSDEIDWCRNYFREQRYRKYSFTFAEPPQDLAGMFVMASCTNHIIANSTYPWWGAWLNPSQTKRVIAPDARYSGPALNHEKSYREGGFHDTKDLIPETWEIVSAQPEYTQAD